MPKLLLWDLTENIMQYSKLLITLQKYTKYLRKNQRKKMVKNENSLFNRF